MPENSFCIPVKTQEEIVSVLKKAEINYGSGNRLMAISLLYQLCAQFEHIRQKTYFPKDKRATDARDYIDTHFNEKNCLMDVTKKSKLTPRRFGEIFRKNFDITPNKYITYRRVEQAKALLVSGFFSVSEVAEKCGFSDTYYFSKVFKKQTGIMPSKWR